MQRFAGLEVGRDAIPDETTILHFRHLLERHQLAEQMFVLVRGQLQDKGVMVREGTITDATIIHAAGSTKNRDRSRDSEMGSTKKGNQWHFGMKAHVGADSRSGLVHSLVTTTASVHDSQVFDDLLHGEEKEVFGDKAYADNARRAEFRQRGVRWRVCAKARRGRELSEREQSWNRSRNRIRARVEFGFGVVKHLWGHRKVRYRGFAKNTTHFFTLFTLSNLYLARRSL
jgi:IS5 family transposase